MPFCIHRAPLSTHERFVAFLVERFGGALPTWLAPVQLCVLPVPNIMVVGRGEQMAGTVALRTLRHKTPLTFRVDVRAAVAARNRGAATGLHRP